MKLVIAGATGFVGGNLLRQALECFDITSIVTLGRRPVVIENAHRATVTDIVLDDLEHYPASAMDKIADADACIWTIAAAITKSQSTPFEVTKKVSYDYPLAGIKALAESNKTGKPLRFIYFSGAMINRLDLKNEPASMTEYAKLRTTVEVDLVEYASNSHGAVEASCARPGYISGGRSSTYVPPQLPPYVPTIKIEDCVAAALKQSVEGIEMDPIGNDDLKRIGEQALPKYWPRK